MIGFNGAATFPPRKFEPKAITASPKVTLQWGRDVSAAEMRVRAAWSFINQEFNGAATFPPRK